MPHANRPSAIHAASGPKGTAIPARQRPNEYALYRQTNAQWPTTSQHWAVRVARQGTVVLRRFSDSTYGGSKAAYTVAKAYRDAALLLIPPLTKRQVHQQPGPNNKSGVVGVCLAETGRGAYWQAHMRLDGQHLSKSFSVKRFGARRAKAMAIAQRQTYEQLKADRFSTISSEGQDLALVHFPELMCHAQVYADTPQRLPSSTVMQRIRLLDEWFDGLRPCFVQVYIATSVSGNYPHLNVYVRLDGTCPKGNANSWGLSRRGLPDTLPLAWEFVRTRLCTSHSVDCWDHFRRRHRKAFFNFDGTSSWTARFRFDRADMMQRHKPSGELALLLPGFEVPAIPRN